MQFYPDYPTLEPRGGRTIYGVIAIFSNGKDALIAEIQGDADEAGRVALSAWRRYHGSARVEILCDGCSWAYVTVDRRTHEKEPFLCQAGFCHHHLCGQIPPEECYCLEGA